MDANTAQKLKRALAAYRRRFPMVADEETVEVKVGGGGYAYVRNRTTGQVARYDISTWRVRFVDVIVGQSAREQSTNI